jgi:hypothetical protein
MELRGLVQAPATFTAFLLFSLQTADIRKVQFTKLQGKPLRLGVIRTFVPDRPLCSKWSDGMPSELYASQGCTEPFEMATWLAL